MQVELPVVDVGASELPAERCEVCKHFGRMVDVTLAPSGQCCKRAPGAYTVTYRTMFPAGKGRFTIISTKDVPCSFPPVWPTDHCGEFEKVTTEGG